MRSLRSPREAPGSPDAAEAAACYRALFHLAADAMLVLDAASLRVIDANRAARALLGTGRRGAPRGLRQSLDAAGLGTLLLHLRRHGTARPFAASLRDASGAVVEVTISAVAIPGREPRQLGLVIRDVARRPGAEPAAGALPRTLDRIAAGVGRAPIRELVREAADAIERLCIESALARARDNRSSAAEILGLSRQSLYVKLRRYGLGDRPSERGAGSR